MARFFRAILEKPAESARRHPDAAAVCLIFLLAFLVYGKGLIPGRIISPAELLQNTYPWRAARQEPVRVNPVLGDMVVVFHPFQIYAAQEVKSGRLPLWNPHAFAGAPFLANMQSGLFCPFNVFSYFLDFKTYLSVSLMAKSGVAGSSMYWFLRLLSMGRGASLLGSIAFMFSGFVAVWLGWSLGSTAVWMPLLFALVEFIRRLPSPRRAAYFALAVCAQFLGGHPETSFHMLVVVVAWIAFRARGPGALKFAAWSLGGTALGALLAAVQLVPFLEYLKETAVYFYRSTEPVFWTLGFRSLMVFLVPFYFGDSTQGTNWDAEFSNTNEMSATVGLVPLILLPLLVFGGWRRPEVRFFSIAVVLSALVIYGNPARAEFLSKVPGFTLAANGRLLLVVCFGLSVLSAACMELISAANEDKRRILATSVAVTTILALACAAGVVSADSGRIVQRGAQRLVGREFVLFMLLLLSSALAARYYVRRPRAFSAGVLIAAETACALVFAARYYPSMKVRDFIPETPAITFLKEQPGVFRTLMPVPNSGMFHGLSDIQGYDAMSPRRMERLLLADVPMGGCGNAPVNLGHSLNSFLPDLLNLKYVLFPPGMPPPGGKYVLEYEGPDGRIYRNTKVLERAFLVYCARIYGEEEKVFDAVNRGAAELGREVVLGSASAGGPDRVECSKGGRLRSGSARIAEYAPERVEVEVSAAADSYLVLTDTFFPGWRVRVDGKEGVILRADYAFRAVRVPAGRHEVVFRYAPASFMAGLAITLAGIAATGFLLWGWSVYKRR